MKLKIKSITEARKSISGNVKFVKKNILPMLKTIGVTSVKVNLYGDQLEVEFDVNPEEFNMFKGKLKKKVGDKGSRKREKFNLQVFEDSIRETIREQLLEEQITVRSAFYELGDKIGNLEWINKRNTELNNDKTISKIAKQMEKLHDQLNKHLDKTYEGWD